METNNLKSRREPGFREECDFKSLAEILIGWWDRHEAEWKANGFDGNLTQMNETENKKDVWKTK